MIILRRNNERRHVQLGKQDTWLSFYPNGRAEPVTDVFGALAAFNEIVLPAGEISEQITGTGAEIFTYIYRGVLAQENSNGDSGVIQAGEFQRMIIGQGIRHKEKNPSRNHGAQFFRIILRPSVVGLDSAQAHMRFPVALRHNLLCVIASPDGRKNSLKILQDAFIYSSILDPGHHLVHELMPGRSAWLHVISGEANLQRIILNQGDGVGVTVEPSISVTAQEYSEILLVDLGQTPRPCEGRIGQ